LSLTLAPGDRLALLGRNGAGKSTVMKLLAGELPALAGRRSEARDLKLGYFAQHQLEQLALSETPFQQLQRLDETLRGGAGRASEQELRDFLAGFGFRGDRVFEPVAPFSGGEKARLVLALVTYRRPNLLLLDEPTNHLDLEMRQALAVALQDFEGAVVLVSHDTHLVKLVADSLWLVDKGTVSPFEGDIDEYQRRLLSERGEKPARDAKRKDKPAAVPKPADSDKVRLGPLKRALEKAEKTMAALSQQRAGIEARLADPAIYSGAASVIAELLKEKVRLERELAHAEHEWLVAQEALETA